MSKSKKHGNHMRCVVFFAQSTPMMLFPTVSTVRSEQEEHPTHFAWGSILERAMSPHEQTHLGTVFLGEIPDSTPHRFWVEILKDIMVMVVRMFLYASICSRLSILSSCDDVRKPEPCGQLQIYKSQKKTAPKSPSKVWNQDFNISKYIKVLYDYKVS